MTSPPSRYQDILSSLRYRSEYRPLVGVFVAPMDVIGWVVPSEGSPLFSPNRHLFTGNDGFEPPFFGPEPKVLPLDEFPIIF